MKNETIINIALFVLFITVSALGGYYVMFATYIIGCFAIGWNIPRATEWIVKHFNIGTKTFK